MSQTRQTLGAAILASLDAVERERAVRAADAALAERVRALKSYQQARLRHTHADLLASSRYAGVARFFLHELYGPSDFGARDAQFARIVPALVRLFAPEIVATVAMLAELHGLSEALDTATAQSLRDASIDAASYMKAWQAIGRPEDRERQIALTLEVGRALDRYTRRPMLMASLRLMRAPARAAGLNELQAFLERGFQIFKGMGGAGEFLRLIGERERSLAALLFDGSVAEVTASGQLP